MEYLVLVGSKWPKRVFWSEAELIEGLNDYSRDEYYEMWIKKVVTGRDDDNKFFRTTETTPLVDWLANVGE